MYQFTLTSFGPNTARLEPWVVGHALPRITTLDPIEEQDGVGVAGGHVGGQLDPQLRGIGPHERRHPEAQRGVLANVVQRLANVAFRVLVTDALRSENQKACLKQAEDEPDDTK